MVMTMVMLKVTVMLHQKVVLVWFVFLYSAPSSGVYQRFALYKYFIMIIIIVIIIIVYFELFFIPQILPTVLRFLTLFSQSYFCLTGPFNCISLSKSLPK